MSLLTEEQVLDLTAAILDTNGIIYWRVKKWNDKQQPAQPLAQFEPDWSKAPKDATGASLNLRWIFKELTWDLSHDIATYDRPAPVITPHPHAALIAKYAEVAARRPDPWAEFEMRIGGSSEWVKCDMPISFQNYWEYRYIGETK